VTTVEHVKDVGSGGVELDPALEGQVGEDLQARLRALGLELREIAEPDR
jgi:hypothetical protein